MFFEKANMKKTSISYVLVFLRKSLYIYASEVKWAEEECDMAEEEDEIGWISDALTYWGCSWATNECVNIRVVWEIQYLSSLYLNKYTYTSNTTQCVHFKLYFKVHTL